jgi:superfamily II DNA or RNA helicase
MSALTGSGLTEAMFVSMVEAEANGWATPDQIAVLEADRERWRVALLRLFQDTEKGLGSVRALTGPERAQVLADFESELDTLRTALARVSGEPLPGPASSGPVATAEEPPAAPTEHPDAYDVRLQLSWSPGRVVAWAAGHEVGAADFEELRERLAALDAPSAPWASHAPVALPDGTFADALVAPVGDVLGWLAALGAATDTSDLDRAALVPGAAVDAATNGHAPAGAGDGADEDDEDEEDLRAVGPSVRWLGRVAVWAVQMVINGSVVPLLGQRKRGQGRNGDSATYSVRWTPALVDAKQLRELAGAMPGSVAALDPSVDGRSIARSALTGMVDAICREAARRVEVPAPSPRPRTPSDVAEAFLGHLDGSQFEAPSSVGGDLVGDLDRWSRPITHALATKLVVQLDPPDSGGAWMLSVLAADTEGKLVSVEVATVNAGQQRGQLEDEYARLERLLPVLMRPGGVRRGEVVVSQPEAWELMTVTGPRLTAAGFEVRVPALSMKKPSPSLRLMADTSAPSVVGAHQLANVSWSVVFDDLELTAADIVRLAAEARPLVRSRGKWVELDKADLDAAAAALAERANKTQMTGADMLRHALGLEGSQLSGGISVEGSGWAADLLNAASQLAATEPDTEPDGFVGELRSYQAEALAWLGFVDSADLGGCLALDMGLGKTPTMLAHLQATAHRGPALVVAPPAVVGNWAAEAARFTPGLRVVVHHGASRASADEIAAEVADADVLITTYGTAVRDVEALESLGWDRMVLDEAQAIKNATNFTTQELRRINARSKLALTGTPIENGLGDLWAILDFTNPGLVGPRASFITQLSEGSSMQATPGRKQGEDALRALNGILVFRRTKDEPAIAAELPDRIDELDHCAMTPEQIGLYQAVIDSLVTGAASDDTEARKGQVLAAITALKQICNHPVAYQEDDKGLTGRSGKLARLDEIVDTVFSAEEKVLVFTHFAEWGQKLAAHLTSRTGIPVACYHGGLSRTARDKLIDEFQSREGAGALVLSLKAGGTGLNLTAARHVVLYDRWWNPAVEDQARDRAWRIGQTRTVIAHRLVCPGTVDERVEEVVAGKRRIADMVLPKSSSLADLDTTQLRQALGLRDDQVLTDDETGSGAGSSGEEAA